MVKEDYVSFEVAELLKEKGFKGQGEHFYEDNKITNHPNYWFRITPIERYEAIEAPTLQMAMKWLREKHNKTIITGIKVTDPITGIIDYYYNGIYYVPKNNGGALCFTSPTPENGYSTYEEACEAAIKYCLENLIN